MTRPIDDPPSYNEMYIEYASRLLDELIIISNSKESIVSKGNALVGYTQLANYNNLANRAKEFLKMMEDNE